MWTVGDQDLNLEVPLDGPVRLELYSPRLDQSDYRADTYYGDEQYDANRSQVATTFTVLREDGITLLQRTFTPGQHDWETLLDQDLPAGRYRIRAATSGNGKNTFAIRLAGISAEVNADQISVNVHSREWVPAVNVTTDGRTHTLRMYDGDGPRSSRPACATPKATSTPAGQRRPGLHRPAPARPGRNLHRRTAPAYHRPPVQQHRRLRPDPRREPRAHHRRPRRPDRPAGRHRRTDPPRRDPPHHRAGHRR